MSSDSPRRRSCSSRASSSRALSSARSRSDRTRSRRNVKDGVSTSGTSSSAAESVARTSHERDLVVLCVTPRALAITITAAAVGLGFAAAASGPAPGRPAAASGPAVQSSRPGPATARASIHSRAARILEGRSARLLSLARIGRFTVACGADRRSRVTFRAAWLLPTSDLVVSSPRGATPATLQPSRSVVRPAARVVAETWQIAPFASAGVRVVTVHVVAPAGVLPAARRPPWRSSAPTRARPRPGRGRLAVPVPDPG